MPSPSKSALAMGILTTACIFVGGAYAATYLADPMTAEQQDGAALYMPSLVPAPTSDIAPRPKDTRKSAPKPVAIKTAEVPATPQFKAPQANATQMSAPRVQTALEPVANSQGLTVAVSGVKNNQGSVYVFVFADKASYDAYDYTQAVGYTQLPATTDEIVKTFPELDGGPYAVGVFHDQNGDQDFNMDLNGYPLEGYGTSNARGKYDEVSYERALVQSGSVAVKMYYLQ